MEHFHHISHDPFHHCNNRSESRKTHEDKEQEPDNLPIFHIHKNIEHTDKEQVRPR